MDKHGKAPKKAQSKHAEPHGAPKEMPQDALHVAKGTFPVQDHKTAGRGATRGR